jgi:flagellar biosynthesis component FlhA
MFDSPRLKEFEFVIDVHQKSVYVGKISDDDLKQNNTREIIKSLYKVCFDYVHYIMTKTDALKLMELIRSQDPMLVDDIIPAYISPFDLKHICANLIQRKVGIKDIVLVFEILNENAKYTQDVNELTDIVEKNLSFAPKELSQ